MNKVDSRYWQNLTSADFADLDVAHAVALLPVSAVEQHGPHLPLATDALINDAIVAAALSRLPAATGVLVLPHLSIGSSLEHDEFPGTLSITHETLLAAWLDVGRSVARAGLRKLVIFNSHGGQKSLVDLAALKLRVELELFVVRANYMSFGVPEGLFDEDELRYGLHGGEIETSLLMHIRPELVRREALENFIGLPQELADKHAVLGVEKPAGIGWMTQDLNPAGACGDALNADAGRGKRYLDHLGERLAALLVEVGEVPLGIIGDR